MPEGGNNSRQTIRDETIKDQAALVTVTPIIRCAPSGLHAAETKYSQDRIRPTDRVSRQSQTGGRGEGGGCYFNIEWSGSQLDSTGLKLSPCRTRETQRMVPGEEKDTNSRDRLSGEPAANGAALCLVLRSSAHGCLSPSKPELAV